MISDAEYIETLEAGLRVRLEENAALRAEISRHLCHISTLEQENGRLKGTIEGLRELETARSNEREQFDWSLKRLQTEAAGRRDQIRLNSEANLRVIGRLTDDARGQVNRLQAEAGAHLDMLKRVNDFCCEHNYLIVVDELRDAINDYLAEQIATAGAALLDQMTRQGAVIEAARNNFKTNGCTQNCVECEEGADCGDYAIGIALAELKGGE